MPCTKEDHFMTGWWSSCVPVRLFRLHWKKKMPLPTSVRLIGATDPKDAAPGTIRKLYADNKGENIVHGSDSVENGKIEIGFFFSQKELIEVG